MRPDNNPSPTLSMAVIGAGAAGTAMIRAIDQHPQLHLAAICDTGSDVAEKHTSRDNFAFYTDLDELLQRRDIKVVYIATPTPLHCQQTISCANAGKHVIVEKPMAITLTEATAMIEACDSNNTIMLVGHSHSFEPAIRAMRNIIENKLLGSLRAINAWYYSDWMFRPRSPEEFDANLGGGVVFRQGAHHADIIRFLGGGALASVRANLGDWQPERAGNGSYSAYWEFEDGTPVTLFYSGYDHFSSQELTFGLGENGQKSAYEYAAARQQYHATKSQGPDQYISKNMQQQMLSQGDGSAFFGLVITSCELGDIRISPQGLIIYGEDQKYELPLFNQCNGREELLNEMLRTLSGQAPVHNGPWGRANLEVCHAMLQSSRDRKEKRLQHQTSLPQDAHHMDLTNFFKSGTQ